MDECRGEFFGSIFKHEQRNAAVGNLSKLIKIHYDLVKSVKEKESLGQKEG